MTRSRLADLVAGAVTLAALGVAFAANGSSVAIAAMIAVAAITPGRLALRLLAPRLHGSLAVALTLALAPVVLGVVMTVLALAGISAHVAAIACLVATAGGLLYVALRPLAESSSADPEHIGEPASPRIGEPASRHIGAPALALALVITGLIAMPLVASNRVRTSIHGMLHASILFSVIDGGAPPENPFFAGKPLRYYWTWHLAMAVPVVTADADPTVVFAAANVAATLAFLLLLAHLAMELGDLLLPASLDRRRLAALGLLLGFTCLNPLGAFVFSKQTGELGASYSPLEKLAEGDDVVRYIQALAVGADERISATLTKFFNVSSFPGALALLVGAWLLATRSLRRGSLADFSLLLLVIAGCIALSPITGLTGGAGIGLGAGLALLAAWRKQDSRNAALATLAALAIGLLVALPFVLLSGGDDQGSVRFGPNTAKMVEKARDDLLAIGPALLLALPALWLALRNWGRGGRLALPIVVSALVLPPLAVVLSFPVNSEYKLVREAALALGVLVAITLELAFLRRSLPVALCASAAVLFFVPTNAIAWNAYRWSAKANLRYAYSHGAYDLDSAEHPIQEIYAWVRANTPPDAVLIDDFAVVKHFAGAFHGAEPPAIAQRAVFTDAKSYMNDYEPDFMLRRAVNEALFSGRGLPPEAIAAIEATGHPIYALLREDSPRRSTSVQGILLSGRFERVFECAAGKVFRWKSR